MRSKITIIALLFCVVSAGLKAQNRDVDDYQTEFIWGINKNTAGGLIGGFVLRKSFKINEKLFISYELEVMNDKLTQEIRVSIN